MTNMNYKLQITTELREEWQQLANQATNGSVAAMLREAVEAYEDFIFPSRWSSGEPKPFNHKVALSIMFEKMGMPRDEAVKFLIAYLEKLPHAKGLGDTQ